MKKLTVALMVIGLFSFTAYAQDTTEDNVLGGSIGFLAQWTITADAHADSLDDIDEGDYDAGDMKYADFFDCTDFDVNDSCAVMVKCGSWTLPGHYPFWGNKKTVTSNSDIHIKFTDVEEAADSLSYQNAYNDFVEITSTDQMALESTTAHGIENAAFQADTLVDLDWVTDVSGTYQITVTFSIYDERP